MKILTGTQIHDADRATVSIGAGGVSGADSSLGLMEIAAGGIARWIAANVDDTHRLLFCCGKGGNGGDGLAAARILAGMGRSCSVLLGASPGDLSDEARVNFARLPKGVEVLDVTVERPDVEEDAVVVDALLGVGVAGEVREPVRGIIEWINGLPNRVIAIDMPSGMATEWGSATTVVEAETTLAIEFPKLALLLPDTGRMAGNVVVVPIGLNREFIDSAPSPYYYITDEWVESVRLPRPKFSHKGDYGHALLVCGSDDMPGAAILAAGGAVRSGCGLVTMRVPRSVRQPLIARHPSVMLASPDSTADDGLASPSGSTADAAPLARFAAIGVGPGLGRDPQTVAALRKLLTEASSPVVLDADALNIVAQNADMGELIPPGSVLTPHPGELKRLTGEWRSEREKLDMATELARKTASTVIVKGAHTVICTADGRLLFNSTGTPGMAKAGSGDVLTGLITGLVARGYDAQTASVIGVYAHGKAGEKAALLRGEEAMNASDLVDCL